jgi:hypothetical protein
MVCPVSTLVSHKQLDTVLKTNDYFVEKLLKELDLGSVPGLEGSLITISLTNRELGGLFKEGHANVNYLPNNMI